MIELTRLNHSRVTLNSDLIKLIEQSPDTVITLVNGEKLLVRETTAEILDRIVKFRRSILCATAFPPPTGIVAPDEPSGNSAEKAGS